VENPNEKIIYDININKLDDILISILKNSYDFAVLEPSNSYCKIIYKKDWVVVDNKYIKTNIYFNILLQAKKTSNLIIEETQKEQKNTWEYSIWDKKLEVLSKTVPSNFWESLFIKTNIVNYSKVKNLKTTKKKQISAWQAFGFLWWILLIALIMWWVFLTFIVNNAKTPSDVSFFKNLWINLNDVNVFLLNITTFVFSIIITALSLITILFLYKAIFTKKEYKRKKISFIIASIFFIVILFAAWLLWITLDKKIKSLPNWAEMSYWKIQLYDNDLLLNENFGKQWAIIKDTTNLIWPIDIAIDVNYLKKDELQNGFQVKKYFFTFWDWSPIEEVISWNDPQSNVVVHKYDKKWTFNLKITLEWIDNRFPDKINAKKEILENPSISIGYLIKMNSVTMPDWWLKINFDASDLKRLWETEWYTEKNTDKPMSNKYYYSPQIIYKKEMVWLRVKEQTKQNKWWDKIFIINWDNKSIYWKIYYEQDLNDDLMYTFQVKDLDTSFWNGVIKSFFWKIWNKSAKLNADLRYLEESSKTKIKIDDYWEQEIYLDITDSDGKTVRIYDKIKIQKKIKLSNKIKFSYATNNSEIKSTYYETTWDYIINELNIPETIIMDARLVRSLNALYYLDEISWDVWWDWTYDYTWKKIEHTFKQEWTNIINVRYVFYHRKNKEDKIEITEKINIDTIEKDAILSLIIKKDSDYTPTTVSFDASLSRVKNDNIIKFIYDYWDWTPPEERDAINPWHIYKSKWSYKTTLTVETEKWKKYSTSEYIVLKDEINKINIISSLKRAPIWQEINFSAAWTIGQISEYNWDFWDWESSTESSPNHAYNKSWTYKVKLKIIFANNNVEEKEIEINIE